MKTQKNIFWILLACFSFILLSGCGKKEYSEDALLVKQAFEYLNEDKADKLLSLVYHPPVFTRQGITKRLQGCIWADDIKIQVDKNDPGRVSFSCVIPGATTVTVNNVLGFDVQKKQSEKLSKNLTITGVIPILTDSKTGRKQMDIRNTSNPFSLYLDIAFNQTITSDINLSDMKTDEDLFYALIQVAPVVGDAYSRVSNQKDYLSTALIPELAAVLKNNKFKTYLETAAQWHELKKHVPEEGLKNLGLGEEEVKIKISDNTFPGFFSKTGMFISKYWLAILVGILIISVSGYALFLIIRIHKKRGEIQQIRKKMPSLESVKSFTSTPNKLEKGQLKAQIERFSLKFGDYKQTQIMLGSYAPNEVTEKGWALAALGRLITQDCTPEIFEASFKEYEEKVISKYDTDISIYEDKRKELIKIQEEDKDFAKSVMFRSLYDSFEQLSKKLQKGILTYASESNVLPFPFFMQVINDNQGSFDRFIRQGAIMGMIDFLMKHRSHEIIKPYFECLIATRRNMISSDNQMSFFEVRAPMLCTAKQYASILKDVLHCANPTIQYCDTEKLMEIAEKEIPGIMDLLVHYPLRLIDPGNETTEGFYAFEPYLHRIWRKYIPPENVGQVLMRYHEVLDMTLPNSSGLNIRLFTDPYSAIPVMFHEYNHYMEDPNEASVFLKTHAFSLQFYRKYKDADPAKNQNFIHLSQLLGKNINPDKFAELNKLILKYYGTPKSEWGAVEEACADLRKKNQLIEDGNGMQTWCPEIKIPLLNDEEDWKNATLIKKIVIRYAQVPREITKEEFEIKRKSFMLLKKSINRKYTSQMHQMLLQVDNIVIDNKIIEKHENWKSFKEWCIAQGYITRYKGNDSTAGTAALSPSPEIQAAWEKYLSEKHFWEILEDTKNRE